MRKHRKQRGWGRTQGIETQYVMDSGWASGWCQRRCSWERSDRHTWYPIPAERRRYPSARKCSSAAVPPDPANKDNAIKLNSFKIRLKFEMKRTLSVENLIRNGSILLRLPLSFSLTWSRLVLGLLDEPDEPEEPEAPEVALFDVVGEETTSRKTESRKRCGTLRSRGWRFDDQLILL